MVTPHSGNLDRKHYKLVKTWIWKRDGIKKAKFNINIYLMIVCKYTYTYIRNKFASAKHGNAE